MHVGEQLISMAIEFDPSGGQKKRKAMRTSLEVCQDEGGGRFVRDALWTEIHSPEEAFELMRQGQAARATASTALNAESSRSHSIFTVRVRACLAICRAMCNRGSVARLQPHQPAR